jgi:hypothetical protein
VLGCHLVNVIRRAVITEEGRNRLDGSGVALDRLGALAGRLEGGLSQRQEYRNAHRLPSSRYCRSAVQNGSTGHGSKKVQVRELVSTGR